MARKIRELLRDLKAAGFGEITTEFCRALSIVCTISLSAALKSQGSEFFLVWAQGNTARQLSHAGWRLHFAWTPVRVS